MQRNALQATRQSMLKKYGAIRTQMDRLHNTRLSNYEKQETFDEIQRCVYSVSQSVSLLLSARGALSLAGWHATPGTGGRPWLVAASQPPRRCPPPRLALAPVQPDPGRVAHGRDPAAQAEPAGREPRGADLLPRDDLHG